MAISSMTISQHKVKHHPKHLWQKITAIIANLSFAGAAIGMVIALIYADDVTKEYKAAIGAITFICFATGIVLKAMADTSIPKLKPNQEQ